MKGDTLKKKFYNSFMKTSKPIYVNQKVMIEIPAEFRKKHHLFPGSEVVIVELEGVLTIIPIHDVISKRGIPLKEMAEIYDKSHQEELDMER